MAGDGEKNPLEGGRRDRYTHGFTSFEMRTLSAFCEALYPSLPVNENDPPALRRFYTTPGSQYPIPDEVAELLKRREFPRAVFLVRVVMLLLSTFLGTLLLCGHLGRFPDLPVKKRERILQKWSATRFLIPMRVVFVLLKTMISFVFFSLVDDNGRNAALEAMSVQTSLSATPATPVKTRPLDKGMFETQKESNTTLVEFLTNKGFPISENAREKTFDVQCDVVIVGSGCGGSVAASILSNEGFKVIVLEKAQYFVKEQFTSLEGPAMDNMYEDGGMQSTMDGNMMVLSGATAGGGSVINWAASLRPPQEVLDEWSQKISFFGTSEYTDALDAVWKKIGVTEFVKREGFENTVLRRGCENLGIEVLKVPRNSPETHYDYFCCFGCKPGDKQSTDLNWLVDLVNNGGVILTGCEAKKFILEKDRNGRKGKSCKGVIAESGSPAITRKLRFLARATVSACGATLTPPLLVSSGLRNWNIGKNLHMHPIMLAWGYFPESASDIEGKSYEGGIPGVMTRVTTGYTNEVRAVVEVAAFGPASLSALFPWVSGADMKEKLVKYPRIAQIFTVIRDTSSGIVVKKGNMLYHQNKTDKENMRMGLRRALRILVAAGAVEVGTMRSDGQRLKCRGVKNRDLEGFLDTVFVAGGPLSFSKYWNLLSSGHQMSTCRLGTSEKDGGVDENGECWEAKGLYVCDASLLPTAVGVNPMVTILATAYCVANRMVKNLKFA